MRVVRNFVQNDTVDSPGLFIGKIALINELSSGCANIYDFLDNQSVKSGLASKQVEVKNHPPRKSQRDEI